MKKLTWNNENQKTKTIVMPQPTNLMPAQIPTLNMQENEQTQGAYVTEDIHIGSVLKNKYKLIGRISHNTGEATLFLAESTEGIYVAKVYHSNIKPKQVVIDRIRNLNSPYVIQVVDDGEQANQYYEILPYYKQGDLLKATPLDIETITKIVVPSVNEGLHTLHEKGIIHRDIKPDNIFLSNDGKTVIIGDLGISSVMDASRTVKPTGLAKTLPYAAPETYQGYVSIESDYYSFGITLFQLVTGITPFDGMSDGAIALEKATGKLMIPQAMDKRIAHLIKGVTVRERKDRWGYEEIQKWCAGEHVPVQETNPMTLSNPYHFNGKAYHSLNELALALGQHWEEGIKHLKRGFISEFVKQSRQDLASDIMDCEEERDNNIALFKAIYVLYNDAPLCWKGEVFTELVDLGKKMQQQLPTINNDYVELLKKGMLLYFLKQRQADSDLLAEVEKLQHLTVSELKTAYYKLYFLLNPESKFAFDGSLFSSVDELTEYLYEHRQEIEVISERLLKEPYFFAWLDSLGFEDHVHEWRKIQYE